MHARTPPLSGYGMIQASREFGTAPVGMLWLKVHCLEDAETAACVKKFLCQTAWLADAFHLRFDTFAAVKKPCHWCVYIVMAGADHMVSLLLPRVDKDRGPFCVRVK